MASILGAVGFATASAYSSAKHGVVGLTQTAAWEHAADGIWLNAVGPGFIRTPLLEANLDEATTKFRASGLLESADRLHEVAVRVRLLGLAVHRVATGLLDPTPPRVAVRHAADADGPVSREVADTRAA